MAKRPGAANPDTAVKRGAKLSIKYTARRTPRGADRRVVYIRYGIPPVTTAEVDIMHQHLEAIARGLSTIGSDCDAS